MANSDFYLTKRALFDIRAIYEYSKLNWGEAQAERYVKSLYADFQKIADKKDLGNLRKHRSEPFLMYLSNKHYVVYEPFKDAIIVITVVNQVRNIENIMVEFGSSFQDEIDELRQGLFE